MPSENTFLLLLCGVLQLPHGCLDYISLRMVENVHNIVLIQALSLMLSLYTLLHHYVIKKVSRFIHLKKHLTLPNYQHNLHSWKVNVDRTALYSNKINYFILSCLYHTRHIIRVVRQTILYRDNCLTAQQRNKIISICVILVLTVRSVRSETAVMHYGHFGGLSITCQRGELILIESERLGYSKDADCHPKPKCSVPYPLAKWYCRGRSTCGGMQVERRPLHKRTCGSDFTNCLRVEYQCIPIKSLTDVCGDTIFEAPAGYIRSPSFPEMYPPKRNCTCSLEAAAEEQVQLYSAFFLLKASTPCDDWVEITVGEEKFTKCGYIPNQMPYVGPQVVINFHTDHTNTEMGFWFKFTGSHESPVTLRCGRYALSQETVKPTSATAVTNINEPLSKAMNTPDQQRPVSAGRTQLPLTARKGISPQVTPKYRSRLAQKYLTHMRQNVMETIYEPHGTAIYQTRRPKLEFERTLAVNTKSAPPFKSTTPQPITLDYQSRQEIYHTSRKYNTGKDSQYTNPVPDYPHVRNHMTPRQEGLISPKPKYGYTNNMQHGLSHQEGTASVNQAHLYKRPQNKYLPIRFQGSNSTNNNYRYSQNGKHNPNNQHHPNSTNYDYIYNKNNKQYTSQGLNSTNENYKYQNIGKRMPHNIPGSNSVKKVSGHQRSSSDFKQTDEKEQLDKSMEMSSIYGYQVNREDRKLAGREINPLNEQVRPNQRPVNGAALGHHLTPGSRDRNSTRKLMQKSILPTNDTRQRKLSRQEGDGAGNTYPGPADDGSIVNRTKLVDKPILVLDKDTATMTDSAETTTVDKELDTPKSPVYGLKYDKNLPLKNASLLNHGRIDKASNQAIDASEHQEDGSHHIIDSSLRRKDGSRLIITDVQWEEEDDPSDFLDSSIANILFPVADSTPSTTPTPTITTMRTIRSTLESPVVKALGGAHRETQKQRGNVEQKSYTPLSGSHRKQVIYENTLDQILGQLDTDDEIQPTGIPRVYQVNSETEEAGSQILMGDNSLTTSLPPIDLPLIDLPPVDLPPTDHRIQGTAVDVKSLGSPSYSQPHLKSGPVLSQDIKHARGEANRKDSSYVHGYHNPYNEHQKRTYIPNDTNDIYRVKDRMINKASSLSRNDGFRPREGIVISTGTLHLQAHQDYLPDPLETEIDSVPYQTKIPTYAPYTDMDDSEDDAFSESIQRLDSWAFTPSKAVTSSDFDEPYNNNPQQSVHYARNLEIEAVIATPEASKHESFSNKDRDGTSYRHPVPSLYNTDEEILHSKGDNSNEPSEIDEIYGNVNHDKNEIIRKLYNAKSEKEESYGHKPRYLTDPTNNKEMIQVETDKAETIIPFRRHSYATGRFQPAQDYISLIEDAGERQQSPTSTPKPTTIKPTTKAPEIITLRGSLSKKGVLLERSKITEPMVIKSGINNKNLQKADVASTTTAGTMKKNTVLIDTLHTSTPKTNILILETGHDKYKLLDTIHTSTPRTDIILLGHEGEVLQEIRNSANAEGAHDPHQPYGRQRDYQQNLIPSDMNVKTAKPDTRHWNKINKHYGYGYPELPVGRVTQMELDLPQRSIAMETVTSTMSGQFSGASHEQQAVTESVDEKEGGLTSDMVWVLIVIAVIGWIIFMALLGMVIYYRRHQFPCLRRYPQISASESTMSIPHRMILSNQGKPFTKPEGRLMQGKVNKNPVFRKNTNAIEYRRGFQETQGGSPSQSSPSPKMSKPSTPASSASPSNPRSLPSSPRSLPNTPATSSSPYYGKQCPSSASSSPGHLNRPLPPVPDTGTAIHQVTPPEAAFQPRASKRLPRSHISQTNTLKSHAATLRNSTAVNISSSPYLKHSSLERPGHLSTAPYQTHTSVEPPTSPYQTHTSVANHGILSTSPYLSRTAFTSREAYGALPSLDQPSSTGHQTATLVQQQRSRQPMSTDEIPNLNVIAHMVSTNNHFSHGSPSQCRTVHRSHPHSPLPLSSNGTSPSASSTTGSSTRNNGLSSNSFSAGNLNTSNISAWTLQRLPSTKSLRTLSCREATTANAMGQNGALTTSQSAVHSIPRRTIPHRQSQRIREGTATTGRISSSPEVEVQRSIFQSPSPRRANAASHTTSQDPSSPQQATHMPGTNTHGERGITLSNKPGSCTQNPTDQDLESPQVDETQIQSTPQNHQLSSTIDHIGKPTGSLANPCPLSELPTVPATDETPHQTMNRREKAACEHTPIIPSRTQRDLLNNESGNSIPRDQSIDVQGTLKVTDSTEDHSGPEEPRTSVLDDAEENSPNSCGTDDQPLDYRSTAISPCKSPTPSCSESDYILPPPPPDLQPHTHTPSPEGFPSLSGLPSPVCTSWPPEEASTCFSGPLPDGTTSYNESTNSHHPVQNTQNLTRIPEYSVPATCQQIALTDGHRTSADSSNNQPITPPEEHITTILQSPSQRRQRQSLETPPPIPRETDCETLYENTSKPPAIPPKHCPMVSVRRKPPTPPPLPIAQEKTLPNHEYIIDTLPQESMNLKKIKIEDLLAARKLKQPVLPPEPGNIAEIAEEALTGTQSRRKRDQSAERLRKLVPHQAHLFNDMVSSELRQILSQRKTKHDPVQV